MLYVQDFHLTAFSALKDSWFILCRYINAEIVKNIIKKRKKY